VVSTDKGVNRKSEKTRVEGVPVGQVVQNCGSGKKLPFRLDSKVGARRKDQEKEDLEGALRGEDRTGPTVHSRKREKRKNQRPPDGKNWGVNNLFSEKIGKDILKELIRPDGTVYERSARDRQWEKGK